MMTQTVGIEALHFAFMNEKVLTFQARLTQQKLSLKFHMLIHQQNLIYGHLFRLTSLLIECAEVAGW